MISTALKVRWRPEDRGDLETRLRAATTEQQYLLRIRIESEATEAYGTRENVTFETRNIIRDGVADSTAVNDIDRAIWAKFLRVRAHHLGIRGRRRKHPEAHRRG